MARVLHSETATFFVTETELADVSSPDPETVYELRALTTAKFRELLKKNTKRVFNKRTGGIEEETNDETLADDMIDWVVAGWTGILNDGQPAECSRANKLYLDAVLKQALIARAGTNRTHVTVTDGNGESTHGPRT